MQKGAAITINSGSEVRAYLAAIRCNIQEILQVHLAAIGCNEYLTLQEAGNTYPKPIKVITMIYTTGSN